MFCHLLSAPSYTHRTRSDTRDAPRVLCLTGHALTVSDVGTIALSAPVNTIYQHAFWGLCGSKLSEI